MSLQLGGMSNALAALVMAVLLLLFVGSAALAYLARYVTERLEEQRKREQLHRHQHAA